MVMCYWVSYSKSKLVKLCCEASTYQLFRTGVGWQMVGLWLKWADGAARPGRVVGKTLFSTMTLTSHTPTTYTLRMLKEEKEWDDNILSHTHPCATGCQIQINGGGKKQCKVTQPPWCQIFLWEFIRFKALVRAHTIFRTELLLALDLSVAEQQTHLK